MGRKRDTQTRKESERKRLDEILQAMASGTHPAEDLHHGVTMYRYGCRCEECKQANLSDCARGKKARKDSTPLVHGLSGYMNWGCRCEECKQSKAKDQIQLFARGKGLPPKPGDPRYQNPPQHGRQGYTYYGCRCEICKSSASLYYRERHKKRNQS